MILKCLYIDRPDADYLRLEAPYAAGFVGGDTLRAYMDHPEYDMTAEFLNRSLVVGDECFAIRDGATLAAYGWYSIGVHHFSDEQRLHFGRQWVYMHHGFTHPAHRGRRLHAIGMTLALAAYQARGFRGIVSLVAADNEASLKSCYRMGYRDFGTLYTLRLSSLPGLRRLQHRLLDLPLAWCTPGCRAFEFRRERTGAARPVGAAPQPLKP